MKKLLSNTSCFLFLTMSLVSNVNATLISYTVNGVDLVYSTISDVTWTRDANLLGTMLSTNAITKQDLINSISVSESDFLDNGQTTLNGSYAFQQYLNKINYGGSNKWQLPFEGFYIGQGIGNGTNGVMPDKEMSELIFKELGTQRDQPWNKDPHFINQKDNLYWTNSYNPDNATQAVAYVTLIGFLGTYPKSGEAYSLFYTPGYITATPVPEPESFGLLLAGLGIVTAFIRRNAKQ